MSKRKSRRPNLPEETLARARAELYGPAGVAEPKKTTPATKATPSKRVEQKTVVSVEDLKSEYIYVISDLRSMGILAGILFVALVIASLIIV